VALRELLGLVAHLEQHRKLAARGHLRVARENLLEQGGARARHADDEEGPLARHAGRGCGGEELRRERPDETVRRAGVALAVERVLPELLVATEAQVMEGRVVVLRAVVIVAERHVQANAGVRAERRPGRKRRRCLGPLGIERAVPQMEQLRERERVLRLTA
jgi:hypothetical protein